MEQRRLCQLGISQSRMAGATTMSWDDTSVEMATLQAESGNEDYRRQKSPTAELAVTGLHFKGRVKRKRSAWRR